MFNDNGHFLLGLLEFFLFFAWIMCLFWVLSDVFRSKDIGGAAKTIWVLFVIVIPWLGVLVYVIIRGNGMQARAIEQQKEVHAAQAAYLKSMTGNSTDEISSAKTLLDNGAITQAEFEQIKSKALAS